MVKKEDVDFGKLEVLLDEQIARYEDEPLNNNLFSMIFLYFFDPRLFGQTNYE